MTHSFNVDIAVKYGVHAAVILENIYFWTIKNKANEQHFYDGHYWTYNSKKAFSKLFPYMSERQVEYALNKLISDNIIITGKYNENKYDQTLWYAITDFGYSILQGCSPETTKLLNEENENVECITDITLSDNKPVMYNVKKENIKEKSEIREIVEYLNEKSNSSYRYQSENIRRHINARLNEGFTVDDFKKVIDNKVKEWANTDMAKYLRPETLFGTKFENYLNAATNKRIRSIHEIDKDSVSNLSEEEKERLKAYYKENGYGDLIL